MQIPNLAPPLSPLAAGWPAVLTVNDPYVRAVPPGQPNSAAFMGLVNGTGAPRALVGGRSDVAEVVELHTHTMEDGMMKMRRVERIDLPAGETVTLDPGGLHVMLIGLKRGLKPGDQIDLTLDSGRWRRPQGAGPGARGPGHGARPPPLMVGTRTARCRLVPPPAPDRTPSAPPRPCAPPSPPGSGVWSTPSQGLGPSSWPSTTPCSTRG